MLLLVSVNDSLATTRNELRLCDLALNQCGEVIYKAEKVIENKNAIILQQNEVIKSAEKVITNQDVQILDNAAHMKRLPYYLLGAFFFGIYSARHL